MFTIADAIIKDFDLNTSLFVGKDADGNVDTTLSKYGSAALDISFNHPNICPVFRKMTADFLNKTFKDAVDYSELFKS